jgi:hypothetical protein
MKSVLVFVCLGLSAFFLLYVPMQSRQPVVQPQFKRCLKCVDYYPSRASPGGPKKCTHVIEP